MRPCSRRQRAAASAAVAGKTARSCDGCARRRARWYCAADDAFLCQSCDVSVHAANPLARRHERIRLTDSLSSAYAKLDEAAGPLWLRRKPRSPRPGNKHGKLAVQHTGVPELDTSVDESGGREEQLIFRVPVICSPPPLCESDEDSKLSEQENVEENVELAAFAADMELLLGHGVDDCSAIETLGLKDPSGNEQVKLEPHFGATSSDDLIMEFNYDLSSSQEDEGMAVVQSEAVDLIRDDQTRKFRLELDYEAIIVAWESHGSSPWTGGRRPQLNLDSCCSEFMWMWGGLHNGAVAHGGDATMADDRREARVMRYREKRRTRLFSKKIRYEVRKLNAEKRPRMKGRFVKRASSAAATIPAGFSY